jgi:uncharacterized protein (DUF4415 family)
MVSRLPVIDDDGEVGDLSEVDPALFRPAHEVLPAELQATLGMRRRGAQKTPTKVSTTIRFDADLLEALKASGEGWQTRVNTMLRREVMGDR